MCTLRTLNKSRVHIYLHFACKELSDRFSLLIDFDHNWFLLSMASCYWPLFLLFACHIKFNSHGTYFCPFIFCATHRQHTLNWLSIVANIVCCMCTRRIKISWIIYIQSLDNPSPGGCWISKQPPLYQHLPVNVCWMQTFYFMSLWVWYMEATTQVIPVHLFHSLWDVVHCKGNGCSQKQQWNANVLTYHHTVVNYIS